jgi:signal transduction histidine kinase
MLTKLPLRSKLILVVSIPLFVILGFATFGMAGRMSDLDAQRQYGRLRGPNDALTTVATDLENEGVLTTWSGAAHTPDVAARLTKARHDTDQAVSTLAGAGPALAEGNVAPGTLESWRTLVARLRSTIRTTRDQFDGHTAQAGGAGATFLDLGNDTLAVSELVARDLSNRDLSAGMLGIVDLRREQLDNAREAEVVLPFVVTGSSDQITNWVSAITAQRSDVAKFRAAATPAARAAFDKVRSTPPPDDLMRPADGSLPIEFTKTVLSPDFYYSTWQAKEDYLTRGIAAAQHVVDVKASGLESAALSGVLWYGLGVSALVLLVLVLTWITIRSVNRSLRTLTEAAREVAEERLPHLVDTLAKGGEVQAGELGDLHPIKVTSKDELGELATAFNTIQRVAVSVAEEQASLLRKGIGDLYVNLARRNQSLLDRQIALLDDMEAHAEDSEYLGSLFELDHLATRMRRNAESLLVMSGAEQPRQWHESIPMLDVVRAATAEITDFARVGYYGFEGEVAVAGNAVADVTHLLAELLENATVFSPPGTPVVVTGMRAERRYVISITDEGIGMTDERLAAANALLARPPATGLALSRTLGLHVVGNLAARYGIAVQLRRAATGGITAVVALPAKVLARLPRPGEGPEEAEPAHREAPVVAVPVDADGETIITGDYDRAIEAVVETPTSGRATFEPVFDADLEREFQAVVPEAANGSPYDHETEFAFDAAAPAAGRHAPGAGEALVFTSDAVFVGSHPAGDTAAGTRSPVEATAAGPAEPITWQPVFTAEARPSSAGAPGTASSPPPSDPPGSADAPSGAGPVSAPPSATAPEAPVADGPPLSRRVPGAAFTPQPEGPAAAQPSDPTPPPANGDRASSLAHRTPGAHLSHKPAPPAAPQVTSEPRPRPERVHDLLSRHLRGIREGRTGVAPGDDRTDEPLGREDDR